MRCWEQRCCIRHDSTTAWLLLLMLLLLLLMLMLQGAACCAHAPNIPSIKTLLRVLQHEQQLLHKRPTAI
jgi:hypothetical protein